MALRALLSASGISHFTSPPHTPEHNGIAERKHRHIVETGLTLLHQAHLPTTYWTYSFAAAVYLINRLPSPVIAHQSPYLKLFNKPPNYLKLRVFGCLCYPWLRPYAQHKLDARSLPCIFLGYSLTQSAYLCLHLPTGRLYTSRHVQFIETQFPYVDQTTPQDTSELQPPVFAPPTQIPIPPPRVQPVSSTSPCPDPHQHVSHTTTPVVEQTGNNSAGTLIGSVQVHEQSPTPDPASPSSTQSQNQPETTPSPHPTPTPPSPNIPTPVPSPDPPTPTPSPPPVNNAHPMRTRAKNKITKPAQNFSLTATTKPIPTIPTSVAQAMRDPNWRNSMGDEYNAQIRNNTFELVPPNPNQNVIATKWIHTIKYLPNGSIDRYKSRWVARGDKQEYGVDYAETFSPVVKTLTIRLVLQVAVSRSWIIKQLDVNNAFLQGTLTDEVYVSQPPGFIDPDRPHHVCLLKKALYGLKQAPRAWYLELRNYLLNMGCTNSVADTSVFTYINGENIIYILVYVDDIIVTGSSKNLVQGVIYVLSSRFSLKEPTDLSYFLGVEATRTSAGLHPMQRKYIIDLLTMTNMLDSKPVTTPLPVSPKLTLQSGRVLDDPRSYRMVVGSLQYLAITRPDISYTVNRLYLSCGYSHSLSCEYSHSWHHASP